MALQRHDVCTHMYLAVLACHSSALARRNARMTVKDATGVNMWTTDRFGAAAKYQPKHRSSQSW